MSLFEYLAIAFSLLLSTSVMRVADGLAHALKDPGRSWLFVGQLLVALLANVSAFWNFWSFHDADWTFPRFVLAVSGPVALYVGSCTLVPRAPESIVSQSEHSRAVRRRFYLCLALWTIAIATTATVLVGMPFNHPARGAELFIFALGAIGASTDDDRIHAGLIVAAIAFAAIALTTIGARPASLT